MSKNKSPKEKLKKIDLYLSYHLKSTELVKSLYNILYFDKNYEIFMNAVNSNKSNLEQINKYLSDSKCILCFITKKYSENENCKNEINYARDNKIPIIILMLEKQSTKNLGELGSILSSLTRYYFYDKCQKETIDFANIWQGETWDSLLKAIRKHVPINTKLTKDKSKSPARSARSKSVSKNESSIQIDLPIELYDGKETYPNGDRYEGELSINIYRDRFD